jgi:hypothetical protein
LYFRRQGSGDSHECWQGEFLSHPGVAENKRLQIWKQIFIWGTSPVIAAFNDESFELDENLLDLALQVFHPIEERNDVFNKLASLLPPLPGVASNAPHDFIEPSSIKPSSIKLLPFEPSPFKPSSIKVHQVNPFKNIQLQWAIAYPQPFQDRHISDHSSSNSKHLNSLLPFSQFVRHLSSRLSIH